MTIDFKLKTFKRKSKRGKITTLYTAECPVCHKRNFLHSYAGDYRFVCCKEFFILAETVLLHKKYPVGSTVYMTNDINKAGIIHSIVGNELLCDEWIIDETKGYEFFKTGEKVNYFPKDVWVAPPYAQLDKEDK